MKCFESSLACAHFGPLKLNFASVLGGGKGAIWRTTPFGQKTTKKKILPAHLLKL